MNDQNPQWIREPIDIPAHIKYAHKNGRGLLTFEQIDELLKTINLNFVERKQGKAYLAQHQARAEMNRIFGYGNFDVIEDEPKFLYETVEQGSGSNQNKTYYIVGYRARVTITVRDLWGMPVATMTGTHAEQNVKLPDRGEAHAMAITSVMSYALRRALINFGDRFGLGLYNGGSTEAHGLYTIQLQPNLLYKWSPAAGQPQVAQSQAQTPAVQTYETIRPEPVISDDGTVPEQQAPQQQQQQAPQPVQQQPVQQVQQAQPQQQAPQQQVVPQQQAQPTPQGNGTVADMQQHAAQQQQGRQQYQQQFTQQQMPQVDPAMAARMQQGFKRDVYTEEAAENAAWEGQG